MIAAWMPPWAILAAIVCGCLMPVFLILLGRMSLALRRPGLRYRVSILAAWFLFLASLIVHALAQGPIAVVDGLAGAAIMVAATITAFVAWRLIAWGFTLNMLLALANANRFAALDDWVVRYTGGGDIRRLTHDRASVLLNARLAVKLGEDGFRLTGLGRIAANAVAVGHWMFGIRS